MLRPRSTDRLRARRALAAPWLVLLAGCGVAAEDGSGDGRPFVPDRAVAPWRLASLTVCADRDCDPQRVPQLQGLDVSWDGAGFLVAAATSDGAVVLGELEEVPGSEASAFVLRLDERPALTPELPWQAGAIVHPDLVATGDAAAPLGLLFGTAAGDAIGWASGSRAGLQARPEPLATAADLGLDLVAEPSGVRVDDELVVAFRGRAGSSGPGALSTAAGPLGGPLAGTTLALDLTSAATAGVAADDDAGWGPLSSLSHPDLGLAVDGVLQLFFQGRGPWAYRDDFEPTPANDSIGYAAAAERGPFAPYPGNPVYNRTYNFLFEADERAPSVAVGEALAVLLYFEARSGAPEPAIAVHVLGQ